ncbi:hypothetical protein BJ742DRAFT_882408 [Cladochytrium replicatum]|nr:hypothetical protein BJ742DRAFT_882408 [Cladochytrium replicatum]
MKFIAALAIAAAVAPLVFAGQYCNADKSFCVNAVVSGANVTVTYGCKASGWCAFGIGNSTDADIVMGWNNSGSVVISDRTLIGEAVPTFDSVQAISPVASQATLDPSHTIKISYTRPVAATGADKAFPLGSSFFIYSMSNTTVSDPSDASSGFSQQAGTQFTADLSAQSSSGSGNATATTRPTTTRSTATAKVSPTKKSDAAPATSSKTVGSLFLGLISAILLI